MYRSAGTPSLWPVASCTPASATSPSWTTTTCPVINGNGELIGIAFDGNWEAMSGDISYEPELQRTISVDIRYVLWTIDKFAGAKHLVDEMTVVKTAAAMATPTEVAPPAPVK